MDLLQNPFYILTATPRDNHKRIMELADERSLLLDANECMAARLALTTPRKRLTAEAAWLPGIGPKRVGEVLALLDSSPTELLDDELPPVAKANALVAALARLPQDHGEDIAEWIIEIAQAFEDVDPGKLSILINEERAVAGFPEVTDISAVEEEIQERRRHYRQVIKTALNNLASKELVETLTNAVESAIDIEEECCPILISDLVDSYEVDAQDFLDKEEGNIRFLIENLRAAVDANRADSFLAPMVAKLIEVVKNWDFVAQPIQVSAKSRGLDHGASFRVANTLRSLTIYMFNEHGKLDFSQQLTNMLQEVFAEVGEIAEHTAEDADALDEAAEQEQLDKVLKPISDLCRTAMRKSKHSPTSAADEALKVVALAPQLIANLSASNPSVALIAKMKDEIAMTLMRCAVVYGNETKKWEPCIALLKEALEYAKSQEVRSRIQENFNIVKHNDILFGGLTPLSSTPTLFAISGTGTALYGSTDRDPASGSYIATYYFVFFVIPIFPISRYRVIEHGNGYIFLEKAPLRTFDKWHIAISLGLIAWVLINLQ